MVRREMVSISSCFIYLFALSTLAASSTVDQSSFDTSQTYNLTIGIIITNQSLIEGVLHDRISELNAELHHSSSRPRVIIFPRYDNIDRPTKAANPIEAVLSVCETFVHHSIGALLLSNENQDIMTPVSISYTLGFYHIPIISINDRDNIFSDKSIHRTFVRTVPGYAEQAVVMADIVNHYQWNKVAVIVSNDVNGRQFINLLWPAIGKKNIEVNPYRMFQPGNELFARMQMNSIKKSPTRVVLVYANEADSLSLVEMITELNMTSNYVWIFNDLLLKASESQEFLDKGKPLPPGLIAPKLKFEENTAAHLSDALLALKRGYQTMIKNEGFVAPTPTQCGGQETYWPSGYEYLSAIKQYKVSTAETGDLAFHVDSGDRINSEYIIYNTRSGSAPVEIGRWESDVYTPRNNVNVIWPGGQSAKPQGIVVSKHLKIVTAVTEPFVNKVRASPDGSCDRVLDSLDVPEGAEVIPCELPPHGDRNNTEFFCCYGYCMDLLVKLTHQLNITYDLHLVADGKFGTRTMMSDDTIKSSGSQTSQCKDCEIWDGSIGEILSQHADMIVAALTIDNERATAIEFSNPFKHQGLSIVVKKKEPNSSLASFIQPFQYQLWILIALSVHVVALILYLLDRFSPFGRFKIKQDDGNEEEDALNLSSAMWFAWGVLLNSGIGEGTPRSFSARVLGVVWAGFAMIIVASYTANLAAFLVLDRPEAEIAGINDARMRNPSEAYKYGTVKESAVQAYFKRKVEMSNMYRFMLKYSKSTAREAIEDVKSGELDAFIWDSAVLDYETSRDCNLVTVGEMFHRSGYGIGMAKQSAWKEKISLEILQFHEDGFMETLDNKWMKVGLCDNSDSQPATLGLENMAGVFMLVGGGIVAGVVLIFIEMSYKRHYGKQEQQEIVARAAFDRWRTVVKKKKNSGQGNDIGSYFAPATATDSVGMTGNSYMAHDNHVTGDKRSNMGGPGSYIPLKQVPNNHSSIQIPPSSMSGGFKPIANGPHRPANAVVGGPANSNWVGNSTMPPGGYRTSSDVSPMMGRGGIIGGSPSSSSSRSGLGTTRKNAPPVNDSTADLKLFDPDFVRERSSAGRASAKSSRGDLHLT